MPGNTDQVLSEREAKRLAEFYSKSEREILEQINKALLRGNQTQYLRSIESNIKAILVQLAKGSRTWCEDAIPRIYLDGVAKTDKQFKKLGLGAKAGFGAIHQQAANALAQASLDRLEYIGSVVGRRWDDIYRTLQLDAAAGQVIGHETWKQTAKRFKSDLASKGITGFIDKAGRKWNMNTYATMVGRTVGMEASIAGSANRILESGHDLIKVSDHSKECPKCRPWENKVLSITGKTPGYTTLAEARAAGLFHPNCRHAISIHLDIEAEIKALEKGNRAANYQKKKAEKAKAAEVPAKRFFFVGGIERTLIEKEISGGVMLRYPVDLDITKQTLGIEHVEKLWSELPIELAKHVKEIQVLDYANVHDSYWADKYGIPGFKSYATGGNNRIHFFAADNHSASYVKHTLFHEAAHNLDRANTPSGQAKRFSETIWYNAAIKDEMKTGTQFISDYSTQSKSYAEDFADSTAYMLNGWNGKSPAWYREKFPNRWAALKSILR